MRKLDINGSGPGDVASGDPGSPVTGRYTHRKPDHSLAMS